MSLARTGFLAPLLGYAERLRFPRLALLTGLVFAVDLVVPDLLPFADELVLGLLTLMLGRWKKRRGEGNPE